MKLRTLLLAISLVLVSGCVQSDDPLAEGQRVAASPGRRDDSPQCSLSTRPVAEPVDEEDAAALAADTAGVARLEDELVKRADVRVCGELVDAWVVTGSLPNGDDVEAFVDRATGRVVRMEISGSN